MVAKKRLILILRIALVFSCLTAILGCRFYIQPFRSGDVIFSDDFSKNDSNWKTWNKPGKSAVSYYKGGLMMIINQPNVDIITTNKIIYPDVIIQTHARKQFGTNDNVYGLVCRFLDNNNYYGFLMSSDGYYGVLKVIDGYYHLLSSENMEFSNVIFKDKEINTITAKCEGQTLSLVLNGSELSVVKDDDLKTGKTGLIAGLFESEEELAVLFDDFVIAVP